MDKKNKVCVTGAAGFLGSSLVKQLLERGYTVHATLRNHGDASKVELLKGLPYADEKLVLFQADIYNPDDFALAIQGCETVIHVATPLQHKADSSQYKNTSEAAVAGVKSIAESCIRSGTVNRLVYTGSVVAASPLKEMAPAARRIPWTKLDYTRSKTLADKEVLRHNAEKLRVVSLACGLVGGDALQSSVPLSTAILVAQFLKDKNLYKFMRFLEELDGRLPIVHIQDVTAAQIFCMDSAVSGRFLCVAAYLKSSEIAASFRKCHPEIKIDDEFIEDSMREISWGSSKLEKLGFQYKYDAEMILSDGLECGRRICNSI